MNAEKWSLSCLPTSSREQGHSGRDQPPLTYPPFRAVTAGRKLRMKIRCYSHSEVTAVVQVFTRSVHALAVGHYNPEQREAWAPTRSDIKAWTARLTQRTTLVAEIDRELAGFISFESTKGEKGSEKGDATLLSLFEHTPRMPRLSRAIFGGIPHHITQRGNRRENVFFTEEDRTVYLDWMKGYGGKHRVEVLAYCLMTNSIHLSPFQRTRKACSGC
jgi:hypothetical protein